MKKLKSIALLLSIFIMGACSQDNMPNKSVSEEMNYSPPSITRKPAPDGARVYFITPRANAILSNPVKVKFGVNAMEIVPSGQDIIHTGHHHIIIDADLPDMNFPIPADENYIHFGDGSAETELTLSPGKHTLQLILGDYLHIPHMPPIYSEKITIEVQ